MAFNKQTVFKQLEKLESQKEQVINKKNIRVEALDKKLADFKIKNDEEKAVKLAELQKKYNEFYEKYQKEKNAVIESFDYEIKVIDEEINKYEKAKSIFEKQEDDLRKLLGEADENQRS